MFTTLIDSYVLGYKFDYTKEEYYATYFSSLPHDLQNNDSDMSPSGEGIVGIYATCSFAPSFPFPSQSKRRSQDTEMIPARIPETTTAWIAATARVDSCRRPFENPKFCAAREPLPAA
jgi:hypothetical protein